MYKKIESNEYGRCARDPIMLKSVPEAYEYLKNLKLENKKDGECIIHKIKKLYSTQNNYFGGAIDHYEILFETIENTQKQFVLVDVYIYYYDYAYRYYSTEEIQLAYLLTRTKHFFCRPPACLFYKFCVEVQNG